MMLLGILAARAATPEVACAAPVRFDVPYAWHYAADRPSITDGVALRLDVHDAEGAALLRPREVGQRVVYVDGWPVEVLAYGAADAAGGRSTALVLAPVAWSGGPIHVGFGGETLPERVDAAVRKREAPADASAQTVPADAGWTVPAGTPRASWIARMADWAEGCR